MILKMTLMTWMAMQYLNAPYRWAANGPFEFDCSGLVLKVLRDVGFDLPDMRGKDIYTWAIGRSLQSCIEPFPDCLLFFGKDRDSISHIAIAASTDFMIEAGGAGRDSTNMTLSQLAKKDARVRISRISRRKDLYAIIKVRY